MMWIRRKTFINMDSRINGLEHRMNKAESQSDINFSEQHVYSSVKGNKTKRYHIVKTDALYYNSVEAIPKWVVKGIDDGEIYADDYTGWYMWGSDDPYIEYYINMGFSRCPIDKNKYLIEEISPEHKSGKFYVLDSVRDVFKLTHK